MELTTHFNTKEIEVINNFNDFEQITMSKHRYKLIQKLININEYEDYFKCECAKGKENIKCKHYNNCFCFRSDYEKWHPIFKEKINTLLK